MNKNSFIAMITIGILAVVSFVAGILLPCGSSPVTLSGNPATGDFFAENLPILLGVLGAAVIVLIVIVILRNKKK